MEDFHLKENLEEKLLAEDLGINPSSVADWFTAERMRNESETNES